MVAPATSRLARPASSGAADPRRIGTAMDTATDLATGKRSRTRDARSLSFQVPCQPDVRQRSEPLVRRAARSGTLALHQIGRATSELQSLMRNSYAVFCLKTKTH